MLARQTPSPNAPHQAIISLTIEIMERLPDGHVTGFPVERFGKIYTVTGKNLEECKEELDKFIKRFSNGNKEDDPRN